MDTVKRAKELIDQSGMTLYQVTQMSGVSYSTITTAARRGTQLSVDTIERLCGAIGISLSDFFRETEDQQTMKTVGLKMLECWDVIAIA